MAKIVNHDGEHEAVHFVTPSGVKGVIATSIPQETLELFAAKLRRQLGLPPIPETNENPEEPS